MYFITSWQLVLHTISFYYYRLRVEAHILLHRACVTAIKSIARFGSVDIAPCYRMQYPQYRRTRDFVVRLVTLKESLFQIIQGISSALLNHRDIRLASKAMAKPANEWSQQDREAVRREIVRVVGLAV